MKEIHCKIWTKNGSQELTKKEWFTFNKCLLHRTDGPAYEGIDGIKEWRIDGKRHRADGPAVELAGGSKQWWMYGKPHRTDGPAIDWINGSNVWWVNGKRHRVDGPAVEDINGLNFWWVNGTRLNTKEIETWLIENEVDLKTPEGQMAFTLRWE